MLMCLILGGGGHITVHPQGGMPDRKIQCPGRGEEGTVEVNPQLGGRHLNEEGTQSQISRQFQSCIQNRFCVKKSGDRWVLSLDEK
jgi:hypothetical protein